MNRVFEPEPTIDLEGESGQPRLPGGDLAAGEPAASRKQRPVKGSDPTTGRPSRQPVLLLTTLGGVCMVSAASTLLYLNHWNQAQQTLQQERNLLLVERLRQLGPANPVPATPPHSSQMQGSGQSPQVALLPSAEQLPPPPEEPWMQELDQLPPAVAPSQPAIQVPVSPSLPAARPAPAPLPAPAPAPSASSGPSPQVVGVVGAKGQAGSAIFQIGSSSPAPPWGRASAAPAGVCAQPMVIRR